MTRTFRNRHTVPHGYEVRDDGHTYFRDGFRTKNAYVEAYRRLSRDARERGLPWLVRYQLFKVVDDPRPTPFRTHPTQKERKAERKADYRRYRAKIKTLMAHGLYDDIWSPRKTGGWNSW